MTVDVAIYKTINKTVTIEGNGTSIGGIAYNQGQLVTLTIPGARAERIWKAVNMNPINPGVSTKSYSSRPATTYIYDYKQRLWSWRIIGSYSTDTFAHCFNFYTDARLLIDDGGQCTLVFQDKSIKVQPMDGQFTWQGGQMNVVDYTFDFIEAFPK